MHRDVKMAVIVKLIYRFFLLLLLLFRSLEQSVARQKKKKKEGATVWIRAFIKQFINALVHSQRPFGVCVCVRKRDLFNRTRPLT